jgi:hypothetical protein
MMRSARFRRAGAGFQAGTRRKGGNWQLAVSNYRLQGLKAKC